MKLRAALLALVLAASAVTFAAAPADPPLTPAGAAPPGMEWVPVVVGGVIVGFVLAASSDSDNPPISGTGTGTGTGTR